MDIEKIVFSYFCFGSIHFDSKKIRRLFFRSAFLFIHIFMLLLVYAYKKDDFQLSDSVKQQSKWVS